MVWALPGVWAPSGVWVPFGVWAPFEVSLQFVVLMAQTVWECLEDLVSLLLWVVVSLLLSYP